MTTEWNKYQKNICEEPPEPLPIKKLCAPCKPNPDYIEPNWRIMVEEPYLNEKTCEYQVCVTIDRDAQGHYISSTNALPPEGEMLRKRLNKFKPPAIILMLEYYGKLIADQIICASFNGPTLSGKSTEELLMSYDNYPDIYTALSQDPLEVAGIYTDKDGDMLNPCFDLTQEQEYSEVGFYPQLALTEEFDMTHVLVDIKSRYPNVTNPYALEIYAYAKDWDATDGILKVLVAIPAFMLDAVPDAPGQPELTEDAARTAEQAREEGKAEIEIDVSKFFGQLTRLSTSLMIYSKYQSHFYQTQDGFIGWKTLRSDIDPNDPNLEDYEGTTGDDSKYVWQDYYASIYAKKVFKFWNQLSLVAKANDFSISSGLKSVLRKQAKKIKIEFDSSDPANPYKFKAVKAKQHGCDYVKFTKSLGNNFKDLFKDPTLMNYIIRINEIDIALQAKKSYPWMDFLLKFTYPVLSINYGHLSLEAVEDSVTQCLADNISQFGADLKDYLLDEVLSLREVFAFEFNSKSCAAFDKDPEYEWFEGEITKGYGAKKAAKKHAKAQASSDPESILGKIADLEEKLQTEKNNMNTARTIFESDFTSYLGVDANYDETVYKKKKEDYDKVIKSFDDRISAIKKEIKLLKGKVSKNQYGAIGPQDRADPYQRKKRQKDFYQNEVRSKKAAARLAARQNRHPYVLKARDLAMEEVGSVQDSILTSIYDFSGFEKSGFSGLSLNGTSPTDEFSTQSGKFSLCAVKSLTLQSIRCLFSGVTEEVALGKIVKTTLEAMEVDVFGYFIKSLPPNIQDDLRGKLEQEFGDLPLPWEEGYDPGDIYNTNYYHKDLNRLAAQSSKEKDRINDCEEKYYRAKEALGPIPPEGDPEKEALLRKIDTAFDQCLGGTTQNPWQEIVSPEPDDVEIPEFETGEFVIPEGRYNQYNDAWTEYIRYTARKAEESSIEGDAGSFGLVGAESSIMIRDLWYEYNYYLDYWTELEKRNETLAKELNLWGGGKRYKWNASYQSWQQYYDHLLKHPRYKAGGTNEGAWAGQSYITVEQMRDNLYELASVAREKQEEIALREAQEKNKERDRAIAENENKRRNTPAESALRDALSEFSEEDLANVYANMRDGGRFPIGRDPDKKGHPGTFGAALGNAQKLIQDAYIEMLIDTMNVDEILNVLDRFPGSQVVGAVLNDVNCSYKGMFKPPIKSFMNTLSLQTCGGFRAGIALPDFVDGKDWSDLLPNFSTSGKLLIRMSNKFRKKFDKALLGTLSQILLKLFQTLDDKICESINAIGKGAGASFSPDTLDDAMRDAFCPNSDADELRDTKDNLFKSAGIDPNISDESFDCLYDLLNSTMSVNEYLQLFTANPGDMDEDSLRKISELVNAFCPDFKDYLGNPDDVANIFGGMAKYIPPELRDALRDLINERPDEPIYSAICLTQEDYDEWNENRKNLLCENGLDCDTAQKLIDRSNERRGQDIEDLADLANKGVDGLLGDALTKMLSPPDPTCDVDNNSIVSFEDDKLKESTAGLMKGFFEMLEKEFFRDLISRPRSVLNNILRDMNSARLGGHELRVNLPFLFPDYSNSEEDWKYRKDNGPWWVTSRMSAGDARGFFPETVGIWMKNQLEKNVLTYKIQPSTGMATNGTLVESETTLSFEDNGDGEGDSEYLFDLKYYVHHTSPPTMSLAILQTWTKRLSRKERKRLGIESKSRKGTEFIQTFDVRPSPETLNNIQKYSDFDYDIFKKDTPFQQMVFKTLLEDKIKGRMTGAFTGGGTSIANAYQQINGMMLNFAADAVLNTPDGDVPTGFKFGYNVQEAITYKDLLYVDPKANPKDDSTWDYTYENEDEVLGKSATENPRVHFLDPKIHGGSYKFPKIYVEPATYNGWLGMIRTFISERAQCEKEDTGFLDVSGISKRAKELESKTSFDERLSMPSDCRFEAPYDKIASPATIGILEGTIIAGIRIYTTEFVLRTLPIFSGVEFSEKNIDSTFLDMLMMELERELSEETAWFNIVQGYTYYLLFMEQAVQVVQRQIIDGLIEETPAIKEAFQVLNDRQKIYDPTSTDAMIAGGRIIAFGKEGANIPVNSLTDAERRKIQRNLMGLSKFKKELASKIWSLYSTRESANIIMRALVENELKSVIEKLNENLRPRPHIENISKYLLSRSGIVCGSNLRSGEMRIEKPILEGESSLPYGDIQSVVKDIETENPLSSLVFEVGANNFSLPGNFDSVSEYLLADAETLREELLEGVSLVDLVNPAEFIENVKSSFGDFISDKISNALSFNISGVFYLEKYLRVTEKTGESAIYNIQEFQDILRSRTDMDPEKRISDYYGNPILIAGEVQGSIGIQFGVRLVYTPPPSFQYENPTDGEKERTFAFPETKLKVKFKDSFYRRLETVQNMLSAIPVVGNNLNVQEFFEELELDFPASKRAIPVASYEYNVMDMKIEELPLDDENFGEDLKCYIDKLVETQDYKVLFEFCFPVKTYTSLLGVYSYNAFFASIGQDESEMDPDTKGSGKNKKWRSSVFRRSKGNIRDIFNSTYRTDDDVTEERSKRNKNDYAKFLSNILPTAYLNIDSSVRWWQSFRIVDIKPFDADGKDCKNAFQKLFD